MGHVVNPLGVIESADFMVRTYDSSNNLIAENTAAFKLTTTANTLTSVTASRDSSKRTVAITSDYTVSFTLATKLVQTGKVRIVLPKDQVIVLTSGTPTTCSDGTNAIACGTPTEDSTTYTYELT